MISTEDEINIQIQLNILTVQFIWDVGHGQGNTIGLYYSDVTKVTIYRRLFTVQACST